MDSLPRITSIGPDQAGKALATLTAAFIADPLFRWVFPDAQNYLDGFPKMISAYCASGFGAGTAFADAAFGGASIWLQPGVDPDDEATAAVAATTVQADRLEAFAAVMEQMDQYHPHDEPIWYLPVIGVDAACQGQGLGSALMKHALAVCDESGSRAYLESSNPANISLYERHGFEVMGRIQVGSSPPVHPMIREKR